MISSAANAHHRILEQHRKLRDLLQRARDLAALALNGKGVFDALATAFGDIRATQEAHSTYEESVMPGILAREPVSLPAKMDRLREEHRDQIAVLARAHQEALAAPRPSILAAKLDFLANWLLTDMAEEERMLQRYAAIGTRRRAVKKHPGFSGQGANATRMDSGSRTPVDWRGAEDRR